MKGRVQYDHINNVVDELNCVFTSKYQLLSIPKSRLNEKKKREVQALKKYDNKETKGMIQPSPFL